MLRIAWPRPTSPLAASGVRARLFSGRAEDVSGCNSSLKERFPPSGLLSTNEFVNCSSPSVDEAVGRRVAHRTVHEIVDRPRKQPRSSRRENARKGGKIRYRTTVNVADIKAGNVGALGILLLGQIAARRNKMSRAKGSIVRSTNHESRTHGFWYGSCRYRHGSVRLVPSPPDESGCDGRSELTRGWEGGLSWL